MTDPYATVEPIPYNPDDPEFTQPVTPVPEPEREHLTAQEAIDRQAEADAAAAPEPAPPGEPPMVTEYKKTYGG